MLYDDVKGVCQNERGCVMKKTFILVLVFVLFLSGIGKATIVDISVATDKSTYLLGEYVTVYVSAYNPNVEPVTLGFPSSLQATYIMDGTYDWSMAKLFAQVVTGVSVNPDESHTWTLIHEALDMNLYPLDIGVHSVVGEVVNYGQTTPAEFEVIPEPITFAYLLLGGISIKLRLRNKYSKV